jgi:DNA (cytosine-5)-methyltransferase 1
MTPTLGSLFTGTAALDQAATEVLGAAPAWFCDNDPAASALLAHHHPNIPNLGDITTVDWTAVEPVDILTGGFPCQDISAAGRRIGLTPGTRSGLWTHMTYAVATLRPALVVIENVRGFLSAKAHSDMEPCTRCVGNDPAKPPLRALGAVLGDLANLGYDATWCGIRASDVGACHQRFRVFVAAADTRSETRVVRTRLCADDTTDIGRRRPDHSPPPPAADAESNRRHKGGAAPARQLRGSQPADGGGDHAAHADGTRLEIRDSDTRDEFPTTQRSSSTDWGAYSPAIHRWERILGRSAPPPTVDGQRGGRVLNPALVEWMMGLPEGHITSVPGLNRNAMLKLGGNGVVPAQAAAALHQLLPLVSRTEAESSGIGT